MEKVAKRIIRTLIDTCLNKDYVLVHRTAYTDLLKSKAHKCSCGGKCKGGK